MSASNALPLTPEQKAFGSLALEVARQGNNPAPAELSAFSGYKRNVFKHETGPKQEEKDEAVKRIGKKFFTNQHQIVPEYHSPNASRGPCEQAPAKARSFYHQTTATFVSGRPFVTCFQEGVERYVSCCENVATCYLRNF